MMDHKRSQCQRGMVAILALLMVALMAMLAAAMYSLSRLNVAATYTSRDIERARTAAETGVKWMAYKFMKDSSLLPDPLQGYISNGSSTGGKDANELWGSPTDTGASIAHMLKTEFTGALNAAGQSVGVSGYGTGTYRAIRSNPIPIDGDDTFTITVVQGSSAGLTVPTGSSSLSEKANDARILHVFSTGRSQNGRATRTVWSQFWIEKSVPHAYQGRVPLQLGKNVLLEGSVAVSKGNSLTVVNNPYIQIISDFYYPTDRSGTAATLHTAAANFRTFLYGANGYGSAKTAWESGSRIPVPPAGVASTVYTNAVAAGYTDKNMDGFIDEYDVAIKTLGGGSSYPYAVSQLSGSGSFDTPLRDAIDKLGAPWGTETPRAGYADGNVDNRDNYAKIRGNVFIEYAYDSSKMQNLDGPIAAPAGTQAVTMGTDAAHTDWTPATFAGACAQMAAESGTSAGGTAVPTSILVDSPASAKAVIQNKVLAVNDLLYGDVPLRVLTKGTTTLTVGSYVTKAAIAAANAGKTGANQATVYSTFGPTAGQIGDRTTNTTYYLPNDASGGQTYNRPIFRNMKFVNVTIPQGMNAYFDNCEFSGVTYVDYATTTGTTTTTAAGTWAGGSATVANTSALYYMGTVGSGAGSYTQGSTKQNNITFKDCSFTGPVAAACPDQQTQRYNQWNFVGATSFDNQWQDSNANNQTTATIMAPQTNIEMGSLLSPGTQQVNMKGVVVAANIDIRASGRLDGSIVTTIIDTWGGSWHSCTMGYFGDADTWGTPNFATPNGGLGSFIIRQNPGVAMPYGIDIPVLVRLDIDRYRETNAIPIDSTLKTTLQGSGTFFP